MTGKHVVLVGVGNIGSFLSTHLGRIREIGKVTLVDAGAYEKKNLWGQEIEPRDVGESKARVQARRLHRIRPDLAVEALVARVETVPLGRFHSDLILTGLDSRRARMEVNRIALRLGIPYIDAGVDGKNLLVRVSRYRPGEESVCLQCGWDDRDYQIVEAAYPCLGLEIPETPTQSPASLGSLAASLQAIECRKVLTTEMTPEDFGHDLVMDAAHHQLYLTSFRRNPRCRLADHAAWSIESLDRLPEEISLAEVLEQVPNSGGAGSSPGLRIEGSPFVRRLFCPGCGASRSLLRHLASISPTHIRCQECDRKMAPVGFEMTARLEAGVLKQRHLRRTLKSFGLRPGEVFSVGTTGHEKHYQLALGTS